MRMLILMMTIAGLGAAGAYYFLHRPPAPRAQLALSDAERPAPVRSLEERAAAAQGTVYPQPPPEPPARQKEAQRPDSFESREARPGQAEFRCDGRERCPQMHSCQEATWFLRNCPNTKMDGEGDGIPCEDQWCPHS